MRPDVTVIVVSHGTRQLLRDCLASMREQTHRRDLQIVVVDNASTDGSAAMVAAEFPEATLVANDANVGFARAVMQGAALATGDALVLLNPDARLVGDAVSDLVDAVEAHPGHGLYGGRTLRPDGSVDPRCCWGLPSLWSLTCFATGLSTLRAGSRLFDPESLGRWPRDDVRTVPMLSGSFLLVTRDAWTRLGGLDQRYFLYGEDADLSLRAARAGYAPLFVPSASVVHVGGASSASSGAKMAMVMQGRATYLRRHWRGPRRLLGLGLLVLGTALRAALSRLSPRLGGSQWRTVHERRRVWVHGYGAAA